MKGFVYRVAIFVAVVSLITSLLSGVSIMTSIIRSCVVFLATLVIIIGALNVLRWGLLKTNPLVTKPEEANK